MRARLMMGAAIVLSSISPLVPSTMANAGGGLCQILMNGGTSVDVSIDSLFFQEGWTQEEAELFFDPPVLYSSFTNFPDPVYSHITVFFDGEEVLSQAEPSGPPPDGVSEAPTLYVFMEALTMAFEELGMSEEAFVDLITDSGTYPIVVQLGAGSESSVECSVTLSFRLVRRPMIDLDPGFLDHYRARVEESELPNTR